MFLEINHEIITPVTTPPFSLASNVIYSFAYSNIYLIFIRFCTGLDQPKFLQNLLPINNLDIFWIALRVLLYKNQVIWCSGRISWHMRLNFVCLKKTKNFYNWSTQFLNNEIIYNLINYSNVILQQICFCKSWLCISAIASSLTVSSLTTSSYVQCYVTLNNNTINILCSYVLWYINASLYTVGVI